MGQIKKIWNKIYNWFTISRVIITIWNIVAFMYHYFFIGMLSETSILIQTTALIMEYILCGPYEKWLLSSNKKINRMTKKKSIRLTAKYVVFTVIFGLIYGTAYYVRLEFFYIIHWGVTKPQIDQSMINMVWFTIGIGGVMGQFVLLKKRKKKQIISS